MADTNDTPTRLALFPDWQQGIEATIEFATSVTRSYSGRDQRHRKRVRAHRKIRYQRSGLTPAEAASRIQAIRDEIRLPLEAPFWPDGITLQQTMGSQTEMLLDVEPIDGEWTADLVGAVFVWTRALGGEFRTMTAISGRNITLSGTGTIYPAGAWVFPCPVMIRVNGDDAYRPINLETGTELVEMQTL